MYPHKEFIASFSLLGDFLAQFPEGVRRDEGSLEVLNRDHYVSMQTAIEGEHILNPWFTKEWILKALEGIAVMLEKEVLAEWLFAYPEDPEARMQIVGLVLAGNIPLVGFHDLMCVLAAGHRVQAKASSKDERLIKLVAEVLNTIDPGLGERISFTEEKLQGLDAVIATGSNNSFTYFEYYFRDIPNIIRKNRNGVAVLTGEESREELVGLGRDIFTYFGMGCRNVSKIYIPEDYDLSHLLGVLDDFKELILHHKYANNVDYHRSFYLMNLEKFLDNGILLLREDASISSPVGVVFYERYSEIVRLAEALVARDQEIQCIVSIHPGLPGRIPPGSSQYPGARDYADGVDTLQFLNELK